MDGVLECVPNEEPTETEVCDGTPSTRVRLSLCASVLIGVRVCATGTDNNGDGEIDEGNPGGGEECTTDQLGECAAGLTQCVDGALVCVSEHQPEPETCDGTHFSLVRLHCS